MRILIEEHQYEVSKIKDIMYGIDALETVEGYVSVSYVGYYYNTRLHDCVFILPKVLLKDVDGREMVFGKYLPEDIIDLTDKNPFTEAERDFIYKFSVWIYRAIVVYQKNNQDNGIIYHKKIAQAGNGRNRLSNTFLDILLSLIQFNKDNRDFFMFILKNLHSGVNKINWIRTIAKTNAIVQDNNPIYLNPVNKKRQINFDEELLVIYYSILNYICDHYGFKIELNCNFELITGKRFEMYLKSYGKTRLLQIKYKYFSDKALKLWKLCFAFFDTARNIYVNTELKEYLLAKNFNIVFEAIIDELVGDKPLPDGMQKKQADGKTVDHLYTAKSLIENEDKKTYYIGDSKYYKLDNELGEEAVYKQYTYARNVIQWNLNIWGKGEEPISGIKLRDDLTEGYNIIPNFFISAKMDRRFSYQNTGIEKTDKKNNHHKSTHFSNRLFDRDTLLLFHYDVNFLYVLSLYARENRGQKQTWKSKIRDIFRKEIQDWLQEDYDFFAMKPLPGEMAREYFERNFKSVLGKVYSPFNVENIFSLALEKNDPENDELLEELRKHFQVEPCTLGTKPEDVLKPDSAFGELSGITYGKNGVLMVMMEKWNVKSLKFLEKGEIAIGLKYTKDSMDIVSNIKNVGFVLFHHRNDIDQHLYRVEGECMIQSANDISDVYVNIQKGVQEDQPNLYVLVKFDSVNELDSSAIHSTNIPYVMGKVGNTRYDAQYTTLAELLKNPADIVEPEDDETKALNANIEAIAFGKK